MRAYMQQSRIFVGMVLILIFGEVLGLYGYVSGWLLHLVQVILMLISQKTNRSSHLEHASVGLSSIFEDLCSYLETIDGCICMLHSGEGV